MSSSNGIALPKMARVRQEFPPSASLDIPKTLKEQFAAILWQIKPGASIAIGVGSRGITNLSQIVRATIDLLRSIGAQPFIFPAMGSHGGATPAGQTELLASYGITASAMAVTIQASMDVRQIGTTSAAAPVYSSLAALAADHILLINRIKPHTDFFGPLGSGLIKMSVIGLGKREGAAAMHISASRFGHEAVIREMASIVFRNTPILGGLAILENQHHDTAALEFIPRAQLETREPALLAQARALMPMLPFDEIDLLIVDRIGKNISGAGLDPNVIGRGVQGYLGGLARENRPAPFIRRIFVRDMTPETHGNAIGIGNADFTTTRLVNAIDRHATYTNGLTALSLQPAKIPIYYDTDRECIERALTSLAIPDTSQARVVRISDTLNLQDLQISESLGNILPPTIQKLSPFEPISFNNTGNLEGLQS